MSKMPISKNDVGIAGEFYMAHMLAKYGFKVNLSLGRTEGFDLFVKNPKGNLLIVSVKTTYLEKNKFLLMSKRAETLIDKNLFYAFIRLNMPDGVPEFWIVPSNIVASVIKKDHEIYMTKTYRNGTPHKENSIRHFYLHGNSNFPDNWEEQLEVFKSNVISLE